MTPRRVLLVVALVLAAGAVELLLQALGVVRASKREQLLPHDVVDPCDSSLNPSGAVLPACVW